MRKENPSGDPEKEYLANGKKVECLDRQSNVCVTSQEQFERMAGYQNLNWK